MPGGLLGIEPLDRVEIETILDRAKSFQPQQTQSVNQPDNVERTPY